MITKEESIRRADNIISTLKNFIEDLEDCKKHFINFYDEFDEANKENLIGAMTSSPSKNWILNSGYIELLYISPISRFGEGQDGYIDMAFTKVISSSKYNNFAKGMRRTKLINDMLNDEI